MLPEKEIKKTQEELIELHKRVLTDYLIREDLSYRSRVKFFHIYDNYIDESNINQFFFCPCKIFVRALLKDKLDEIPYVGTLPDRKLRRHKRKKHNIISF